MTDVIQLLEALARRPQGVDDAALADLAAALGGATGEALRARDPAALAQALGLPATFACIIATPEPEAPAREDAPDGDDEEEAPADPETRAA